MPYMAFVMCAKLANDTATNDPAAAFSQRMAAMAMHARGEGDRAEARRRPDATIRAMATATIPGGKLSPPKAIKVGEDSPAVDYRAAWRNHVEARGAGLRANANMGLHLLVGVSPDWIAAEGDRHDPGNPRNVQLFTEARRWAQKELGGVFGVRMDFDEKGAGVVDVFAAPIREQGRKGARRNFVGVSQALDELAARNGRVKTYEALQDSWAAWAKRELSPEIERGRPTAETGRQHLTPEGYGQAVESGVLAMHEKALAALEAAKSLDHRTRRRTRRWTRAIGEMTQIVRHEKGAEWTAQVVAIGEDLAAAIAGDDEADKRLADRYAKGGAEERGLAHTR